MFTVYILRIPKNQLYIGQTNDLSRRLKEHTAHYGAKYPRSNVSYQLVYTEEFESRVSSMQRENQLKRWTRAKKEALISGDLKLLKIL